MIATTNTATVATIAVAGEERVVDTRFAYSTDECIHVMRWDDLDGEPYFYAVDAEFTSIGPTRRNHAMALLDGRRHLRGFRPECFCSPADESCTCVHARRWRGERAAGA